MTNGWTTEDDPIRLTVTEGSQVVVGPEVPALILTEPPRALLYRTVIRPVGFGGLPDGVRWEYVEAPRLGHVNRPDLPQSIYPYGVFKTDRPLTRAEMDHFDIAVVENGAKT